MQAQFLPDAPWTCKFDGAEEWQKVGDYTRKWGWQDDYPSFFAFTGGLQGISAEDVCKEMVSGWELAMTTL